MDDNYPIQLNERINLIDGFDLGVAKRTGTYVINENELTIVDTGPSSSIEHVRKGLKALGHSLDDVKYIIVTHVHLDHSGGAGLLLKECPNATVIVHPRGARHLTEPERLIAGAKMVYGDRFKTLFEPVIPIPKDRLLVKENRATLEISSGCELTFLDSPGHAKHHFSIYDPISNGMFTGDTVGIRYEQLIRDGIDLYLPSTSPNQFDPDAMQTAIDKMLGMDLDCIYFGHFGMTDNPQIALQQVSEWLAVFMVEAEAVFAGKQGPEVLANRLFNLVQEHLRGMGISDDHEVYYLIGVDMEVSSMGMIDYLMKKSAVTQN